MSLSTFSEEPSYKKRKCTSAECSLIVARDRSDFSARYLAVNYDRSEFTIAQASFPAGNNERDIVVFHHKSKSSLHKGAIAGICITAIAVVAIIICRLVWLWHQKRQAKERRWGTLSLPSLGGTTINDKSNDLRGWIKPLECDRYNSEGPKPELDANATARCVSLPHRHELDVGEDERASEQSRASDGSERTPVELDGGETLVGESSTAVSPLRNSEISLSPLPPGYPSPPGNLSTPSSGRRPSLGRLKTFFHELQSVADRSPKVEQKSVTPGSISGQPGIGGEKSPLKQLGPEC